MTTPTVIRHQISITPPSLHLGRRAAQAGRHAHRGALTVVTTALAAVVAVTGRVRAGRSILLHAAAAVTLDAGIWDLAGRGWALLAAAPLLVLLDLAAGDSDDHAP